ncbi:MAG TPA: VOC family protein [Sporichthyaceae bacterium]
MSTTTAIAVQPGHVGLNVTDLERSLAFYTRVLDLQTLGRSEDADREWVFLGRDGQVLLTLWRQSDGAFDATRPGLHHLALRVDSIEELHAVQDRLAELGVERRYGGVVLHTEGADSGGVYFADPDGIRLEVFAPSGVAATGATAASEHGPSCGGF